MTMLLPAFHYHRPTTADEALDLLARLDDAAVYMGGTELLLLMKLGLAEPEHLVDCKHVPELRGIEVDGDDVVLGAATTIRALQTDDRLQALCPALPAMAATVANVRIRNVGTLGGNLCFAEPRSDPATLLMALDAEVLLWSASGDARWVPVEDFFVGPLQTVKRSDELMAKIRFPRRAGGANVSFKRFSTGDRPMVNCAARIARDGAVRLVVGAVGPRPMRMAGAEAALADGSRDLDAAVEALQREVQPRQYEGASEDYERHLVGVVARAALREAMA